MLFPALSLQLSAKRPACVLDPDLALTFYGPTLARSLGEVMEVWLVPELWHILDNTCVYLDHPELLTASEAGGGLRALPAETACSLRWWERLRFEAPPNDLRLYWMGDDPTEGRVPEGAAAGLVPRWRALARGLDAAGDGGARAPERLLAPVNRDTAALAAALGPAVVLTCRDLGGDAGGPHEPLLCSALGARGIFCTPCDLADPMVRLERELLHRIAVQAGIAKLLWAGASLAVLHLFVPGAAALFADPAGADDRMDRGERRPAADEDVWRAARGYWYPI